MLTRLHCVAFSLLTALVAVPALAQDGGPGGGPGGGGPGGGPPGFGQMQQRFADRMKDLLGVSDDQWTAIAPTIDQIRRLQHDISGGGPGAMGFGPGGPGGPGGQNAQGPDGQQGGPQDGPPGGGPPGGFGGGPNGPPTDQQRSDVQQKQADLLALVRNSDSSKDDILAKVAALRDARSQAQADLVKAQATLRSILTLRQEAAMVAVGILN